MTRKFLSLATFSLLAAVAAGCGDDTSNEGDGAVNPGVDGAVNPDVDGAVNPDVDGGRTPADVTDAPPLPDFPDGSVGIVVDGTKTVSATGGDDLTVRPYRAAAAFVQRPYSFPTYASLLSKAHFKSIRGVNVDNGCNVVSGKRIDWMTACGGNVFFDAWIQSCIKGGFTPYLIAGQALPSGMTGTYDVWTPGQKDQYQTYLNALVETVVTLSPTGITRVAFGNEAELDVNEQWLFADGAKDPWALSRYEGYRAPSLQLWKAVQLARTNHPDKTVEFYGMQSNYDAYFGGDYGKPPAGHTDGSTAIMDYCVWAKSVGMVLDGRDIHVYDDPLDFGAGRDSMNSIFHQVIQVKEWLKANGHGTKIIVGEYGLMEPIGGRKAPAMYDDHRDATQMVVLMKEVMDASGAEVFTLDLEDLAGSQTSADPISGPSLVHVVGNKDGSYTPGGPFTMFPKPSLAAGLLAEIGLNGVRKLVDVVGNTDVNGIASTSSTEASVLLYNWNLGPEYVDQTVERRVEVHMIGLTFSGARTADRTIIDSTHGNLNALLAAGTTLTDDNTKGQLVESLPVTVDAAGRVVLPLRAMGKSSVTLWRVH